MQSAFTPSLAARLNPPSDTVYRQLLNIRTALKAQGHDPLFIEWVMIEELTRFLAEMACETSAGHRAERARVIGALDTHLQRRGHALPPTAPPSPHNAGAEVIDPLEQVGASRGLIVGLLWGAALWAGFGMAIFLLRGLF
jgi:hypothetical protein